MVGKTLKIINQKGKIMLKNKLLKIFGIALFVCLITMIGKVSATMPECKLDGRTLTIINKEEGKFSDAYEYAYQNNQKFDCLVLKGVIHPIEFVGVESIGNLCRKIDLLDLKIRYIPAGSFKDNHVLEELVFPAQLETIQQSVCYGCYNLTKVTLPKNLKVIADFVFQYCKNLKLRIPRGVKIGKRVGACSPGVILLDKCDKPCTIV